MKTYKTFFLFFLGVFTTPTLCAPKLVASQIEKALDEALSFSSGDLPEFIEVEPGRFLKVADLLVKRLGLSEPIDIITTSEDLKLLPRDLSKRDVYFIQKPAETPVSEDRLRKVAEFLESRGRKLFVVQVMKDQGLDQEPKLGI